SRVRAARQGLILGPHDPTCRCTYWPRCVSEGGEVLAPGEAGRQIQFIDARDLAEWIVGAAEKRLTGVYNTNGPENLLTMAELLDECRSVSGSDVRFTWVSDELL